MIEKGEFREDLLYRLNLIALHCRHCGSGARTSCARPTFLQNIGNVSPQQFGDRRRRDEMAARLQLARNIRELKHLIERTVLMSNKDILEIEDFTLPANAAGRRRQNFCRGRQHDVG
jgi:DNA-binding NtrC family response regulator